MKFYIKTFGCRLNFAESDELAQKLSKKLTYVNSDKIADIVIIRACAVTSGAEQGARQAIRKYKRKNKQIYVLGCFREKIPEANKYFKSDEELLKYFKNKLSLTPLCKRDQVFATSPYKNNNRARAFIKIQDGCYFKCSFCLTRLLRGKSKLVSPAKILRKIKEKETQGCKEIVLTGTNILLYKNIHNLIKTILKKSTIPRIRFGSIDPRLITQNFLNLFKNPRLMPHLHLSVQSGSEKILRDMARPIKISKIKSTVKKLRAINSLFNISADIIVGFPTETDNDFKKSLNLAKELHFSKIHYFPYSVRPGTSLENVKPLDSKITKQRLEKIKKLDKTLQLEAEKKLYNKKIEALFEYYKNGSYCGYTPNFVRVKHPSKNNLTNKIKEIIIGL